MRILTDSPRQDFGADLPAHAGSATRAEPLVVKETRDYVSVEYFVARLCLDAQQLEYELEEQPFHEIDGRMVDELVYSTKPKGGADWTHMHRYFFDITAGFSRLIR